MVIEKGTVKVRIDGKPHTKQVTYERWLTTPCSRHVFRCVKHNGVDYVIGCQDHWDVYELVRTVEEQLKILNEIFPNHKQKPLYL